MEGSKPQRPQADDESLESIGSKSHKPMGNDAINYKHMTYKPITYK